MGAVNVKTIYNQFKDYHKNNFISKKESNSANILDDYLEAVHVVDGPYWLPIEHYKGILIEC